MPEMMAMMIQARLSSRMAVARMSWPRSRRMAPISISTMPTILTDEMDSAVPRKSAVTRRVALEGISVCRQRIGQGHPADERHRDAEQRCRDHRPALAVHQGEVGLHAGQQQQEQNTDLRDGIDHALERRRFGKNEVPQIRQHGAEDRGAEQHARQQLAEDRRLADAGHALADQPAEKQQQDQLGREDRRRVVSCHACLRLR